MRSASLLFFACVTIYACKKNNTNPTTLPSQELTGTWRMVSVKDNALNITTTKPADLTGDVDMTFTFSSPDSGAINGSTTRNVFGGKCSVGNPRILLMQDVYSTEVNETSWGFLFLDNIYLSENYQIGIDNKLNINTSTNKTLTFSKQ
ncbi:MAG: hypothetical protein V4685_17820 [Bacteroidota bacterium]